jgi:Zn-dependent protease
MDSSHVILAIFQFAVLLFSLSLHEAAHAWMASRLGDPTARMLGRVTLNPIKHIDLLGTIILPAIMLIVNPDFIFGWAKPTPVTTSNFKNLTRDDILTTIAGPGSNILAALGATLVLLILSRTSANGAAIVHYIAATDDLSILGAPGPLLVPIVGLFYLQCPPHLRPARHAEPRPHLSRWRPRHRLHRQPRGSRTQTHSSRLLTPSYRDSPSPAKYNP